MNLSAAIAAAFGVTQSFRIHSEILIWSSRNIECYCQCNW